MKITTRLFLGCLVAVILPVGLLAGILYTGARHELTESIHLRLARRALNQRQRIESMARSYTQRLNLVRSRTQLRLSTVRLLAGEAAHRDRIERILRDAVASVPDMQAIEVRGLDGSPMALVGEPAFEEGQASASHCFHRAARGVVCLDLFKQDGLLKIRTMGPLELNDQRLGVVTVVSSADDLLRILQDPDLFETTGETVLVRRTKAGDALVLAPLRFDREAALRKTIPAASGVLPVDSALAGEARTFTDVVDYRGASTLAATQYLPALEWGLVAKIDAAEALAPVRRLAWMGTAAAGLAAVLALLVAAVTSRTLAGPIRRLTATATEIAEGQLERRAPVGADDEIGRLARAFNRMAEKLVASGHEQQQARRRLSQVIESAPNAMIQIDAAGRIVLANVEAERLFGYEHRHLLGETVEKLVPECYRDAHPALRAGFFEDPQARSMGAGRDLRAVRQDGSEFPVEIGLNPIRIEGDLFVLAAIVDITERKQSEYRLRAYAADLKRSNQELDEFAYVASHDLKAPLRGIDNLAQWLAQDLGEGLAVDSRRHLHQLQQRVRRMEGLLDDLLQYSRAGRMHGEMADVDTAALVRDLADMLSGGGAFEIALAGEMPTFRTLKVPLEQVLRNLIHNAIKHHDRDAGKIVVSAQDAGPFWLFSVADDGPGIDRSYHERVFRMFQTLKPRDEVEGSGMGLAVIKKIVESYGGQVFLESGDGRGARFLFQWPKEIQSSGRTHA